MSTMYLASSRPEQNTSTARRLVLESGHPRKPKTAGCPEPCCHWKWFLGNIFFQASHGSLRPIWVNVLRFAMGRTLQFFSWDFQNIGESNARIEAQQTLIELVVCHDLKGIIIMFIHFPPFHFSSMAMDMRPCCILFWCVPHCIFKMFFLIASRDVRTLSYVTPRTGVNIHSVTNFWSSKSRSHRAW